MARVGKIRTHDGKIQEVQTAPGSQGSAKKISNKVWDAGWPKSIVDFLLEMRFIVAQQRAIPNVGYTGSEGGHRAAVQPFLFLSEIKLASARTKGSWRWCSLGGRDSGCLWPGPPEPCTSYQPTAGSRRRSTGQRSFHADRERHGFRLELRRRMEWPPSHNDFCQQQAVDGHRAQYSRCQSGHTFDYRIQPDARRRNVERCLLPRHEQRGFK